MNIISGIGNSGFLAQSAYSADIANKDALGRVIDTTYLTAHQDLSNYATKDDLSAYTERTDFNAAIESIDSAKLDVSSFSSVSSDFLQSDDLNGYATENWVTSKGYLTALPSDLVYTANITGKQDITGMTAYQPKSAMNTYLTNWAASITYQLTAGMTAYQSAGDYYSASNPSAFVTSGQLSTVSSEITALIPTALTGEYLDKASADTLYYPLNTNPSGYLTAETDWTNTITAASANAYAEATAAIPTGLATENWVTSQGYITNDAITGKQDITGMTAYLTTADSAQFITALPADLVYTADITGFATTADLTSKLDKSDSANFYTTANKSGFITGIPDEVTDATSVVSSNSANWNSTYNTVTANSADWSVSEEISGINGIKISESADKVIIEVSANYATEDWVTGQGYLTAHQDISNKLDTTAFSTVSGNFLTAVPTGYATEDWVTGQGYITGINYNTGSI